MAKNHWSEASLSFLTRKRDGKKYSSPHPYCIHFEFLSSSDNKEDVAKASNVLFEKYLDSYNLGDNKGENIFTKAHLTEAQTDIGKSGYKPDLLLVYGPVRQMGPLKDMIYDSFFKGNLQVYEELEDEFQGADDYAA